MAYLATKLILKDTAESFGLASQSHTVSVTSQERPLITIEFAPNIHSSETQYSYEHSQFVFGDKVELSSTSFSYPPVLFTIAAMELVESKTPSGELLNQPYWKYRITNTEVSFWKEESALIRSQNLQNNSTCADCPQFNNFRQNNARRWCPKGLASRRNLFDRTARKAHSVTNDCIINKAFETEELAAKPVQELEDELDRPHSEYQEGSIVKVIDPDETHTEWGVFKIVECKHNHSLYNSQEIYLNEAEWFYLLSNVNGLNTFEPLWVGENEICLSDMSENVCAHEVF